MPPLSCESGHSGFLLGSGKWAVRVCDQREPCASRRRCCASESGSLTDRQLATSGVPRLPDFHCLKGRAESPQRMM
jgi:hypothetical protein